MKIESRPRRSGKTTELIEWLTDQDTDEDRVLLAMDRQEADYMVRNYHIPRRQIVVADPNEIDKKLSGRRPVIRVEEGQYLIYAALSRLGLNRGRAVELIFVLDDDSIEG